MRQNTRAPAGAPAAQNNALSAVTYASSGTDFLAPCRLLFGALRGLLARRLGRDLLSRATRFGEPDGDRLFAARHFLSGATGAKGACLLLPHRLRDLLARGLAVTTLA